ncbi:hypothetical protein [Hydrogenophaga sp. PBC]|nr:hypothetical protein [Hydrogenophaga sp. PBC]
MNLGDLLIALAAALALSSCVALGAGESARSFNDVRCQVLNDC